jgi:hypothetical protein
VLPENYGFYLDNSLRRMTPHSDRSRGIAVDPMERSSAGTPTSISIGLNVAGISNLCNCTPPDTNAAVGDTQLMEGVNVQFEVLDKTTGAVEFGPVNANTLWRSLGGPCATHNDVGPIVQWDRSAHRWLYTQNVLSGPPPYYACVAVSQTPDATGNYYLYQFPLGNGIPVDSRWGVWSTGYFQTNNSFSTTGFLGAQVCAYNSAKLVAGDRTAEQICFQLTPSDYSLLPADVDSILPPPNGQDEFLIGSYDVDSSNNHLYLYSMHPDYPNPTQSTFVGSGLADPISVPAYTPFCDTSQPCVPQEGTGQQLNAVGDRLMYRFAYWNDGQLAHVRPSVGPLHRQHWYVNHVATASGGQAGVRWYEFRAPIAVATISDVTLFQSGTFAPDSSYRWMASMAQDKVGDIALGYSIASANMYDSINATGRVISDPPGQMESEVSLVAGTGSQSEGSSWGKLSTMVLDGSDSCTFWYAQEYYAVPAGGQSWLTRLVSFKFDGCR